MFDRTWGEPPTRPGLHLTHRACIGRSWLTDAKRPAHARHARPTATALGTSRALLAKSRASHLTQWPLLHELAHALGVGYAQFGRERAEVIVDTVTFIVCGSVGLDVGGESIPYVAGWGEHGALEAVTAFAETIDALARRLEDALADTSVGDELAA